MEEMTDSQKEAAKKWLKGCQGWMITVSAENDPLCPNEHGVDNDDEYIRRLISEELPKNHRLLLVTYNDWIKPAYAAGVVFILKRREYLDLRPETAYLAIMYLIHYLSKDPSKIEDTEENCDEVKLIAVACLSLAAKWDIRSDRVMAVEWGEEPRKFRTVDYCKGTYTFSAEEILDMELVILRELDNKMGFTTAFHFTHYFAKKLFPDLPQKNVVAKMELAILSALRLTSESALVMMRQRSSVVALAAIIHLIAVDNGQSRQETIDELRDLAEELGLDIDDTPAVLLLLMEL